MHFLSTVMLLAAHPGILHRKTLLDVTYVVVVVVIVVVVVEKPLGEIRASAQHVLRITWLQTLI